MKIRILGCGTSTGVPKIGNHWGQCDPSELRNFRLRTSILVESRGERLLVDCGPDLRQQLLAAEVGRLDGVIVTHAHGDHCHGIDELRPVSAAIGGPVPLYARAETLNELNIALPMLSSSRTSIGPSSRRAKLRESCNLGR